MASAGLPQPSVTVGPFTTVSPATSNPKIDEALTYLEQTDRQIDEAIKSGDSARVAQLKKIQQDIINMATGKPTGVGVNTTGIIEPQGASRTTMPSTGDALAPSTDAMQPSTDAMQPSIGEITNPRRTPPIIPTRDAGLQPIEEMPMIMPSFSSPEREVGSLNGPKGYPTAAELAQAKKEHWQTGGDPFKLIDPTVGPNRAADAALGSLDPYAMNLTDLDRERRQGFELAEDHLMGRDVLPDDYRPHDGPNPSTAYVPTEKPEPTNDSGEVPAAANRPPDLDPNSTVGNPGSGTVLSQSSEEQDLFEGVFKKGGGLGQLAENWRNLSDDKRARISQSLIAGGAAMMTTPGNFGEGLGAGMGAMNDAYVGAEQTDIENARADRQEDRRDRTEGRLGRQADLTYNAQKAEYDLLRENWDTLSETKRLEAAVKLKELQRKMAGGGDGYEEKYGEDRGQYMRMYQDQLQQELSAAAARLGVSVNDVPPEYQKAADAAARKFTNEVFHGSASKTEPSLADR